MNPTLARGNDFRSTLVSGLMWLCLKSLSISSLKDVT